MTSHHCPRPRRARWWPVLVVAAIAAVADRRTLVAASANSASFLTEFKHRVLNDIIPVDDEHGPLTVGKVDSFNNVQLEPLLSTIAAMDYFRFVKLNLKKKCTLWLDNTKCALRWVRVNRTRDRVRTSESDEARMTRRECRANAAARPWEERDTIARLA